MTRSMVIGAMIVALGAGGALAQGAGPGRGGGRAGAARVFDPKTVVTVSGEATAVRTLGGRNAGVHVDLKAADASYDVHVGPAAFLASKGLQLEKGDRLEVTGSRVEVRGKPALIAQSVKKGDQTVTLRDASGVPAWSRRGAR